MISTLCYLPQVTRSNNSVHVQLNWTIMYLFLLSSLLHITTCTVYTVTPDDHYYPNTTCHHCHNLQHYLLNITKYFTSNTQLLFLPGLHHLHTDLIIQNVHNISLIGSMANGTTLDTVIKCMSITITKVSNLKIKNLIVQIHATTRWENISIKNCFSISLNHLQVKTSLLYRRAYDYFNLVCINIMGSSNFKHITLQQDNNIGWMNLLYNEMQADGRYHLLTLDNCKAGTTINMLQMSYIVTLKIINVKFDHDYSYSTQIIIAENLGSNNLLIINCQFISNTYINSFIFNSSSNGSVKFINCQFEIYRENFVGIQWGYEMNPALIELYLYVSLQLNHCNVFSHSTKSRTIVQTYNSNKDSVITQVLIKNTTFIFSKFDSTAFYTTPDLAFIRSFIILSHANLKIEDSVVFSNITTPHSIISLKDNSSITITGSVEFSYNHVNKLISFYDNEIKYIIMKENSVINIIHNKVLTFLLLNLL